MAIDNTFTKTAFEDPKIVEIYRKAVNRIGLWNSEKYYVTKYFKSHYRVLDLGCGCGRTTFGIHELGYGDVTGIDLASDMIACARKIAAEKSAEISFIEADAGVLPFEDAAFDSALFSYNGIMHIPGVDRRMATMKEINRVLRPEGIFIFITQMREDPDFILFWEDEKKMWDENRQDPRLHEFGDVIFSKKKRDIFLHVPTVCEIRDCAANAGFVVVESKSRHEAGLDRKKTGKTDSTFWILRKP